MPPLLLSFLPAVDAAQRPMKHFLFLTVLTAAGGVLGLASPFWPLLAYYVVAVLQPAVIWDWALSGMPEVRWAMLTAGLLFVSVLLHGKTLIRDARPSPVLLAALGFAGWVLLSGMTAYDVGIFQSWFVEFAKVLLIFSLGSLIVTRWWQVRLLALAAAGAMTYVALSINVMYLFENGRLDVFHHGMLNLDNNGVGSLLAIALPLTYYAALNRAPLNPPSRWVLRVAGVLAAGLMAHAIVMTYSRGAMLAAVIGIGWLAARHRPRAQAGGLAVLALLGALMMAGPEVRDRFWSTTEFQQDESAQSRLQSWDAAWDMIWSRPLLGVGMRNAQSYTHNFGADLPGRTVHNQYLQIGADSGVPAVLLYLAVLGLAMARVGHIRRVSQLALREAIEENDTRARDRAIDAERMTLALQASLASFVVSAMFLSVEVVELPWLILMLAAVTPEAARHRFQHVADVPADETSDGRTSAPSGETAPVPTPPPGPSRTPAPAVGRPDVNPAL